MYKHEMIGIWQRFHRNFEVSGIYELTVFELILPDLYFLLQLKKGKIDTIKIIQKMILVSRIVYHSIMGLLHYIYLQQ